MMVFQLRKKVTASRKTEQSKLRWKDEYSPTNSRSFKLVNKGLETSSLMESFLTFLKEIEGTTVQLLGGDCISWTLLVSLIFTITISVTQL